MIKPSWVLHKISLVSILFLLFFGGCKTPENKFLLLGKGGNLYSIVLPDTADEVARMAATELQYYFKLITGEELKIENSGFSQTSPKGQIYLRLNNDPSIKWDGYKINIGADSIELIAHESRGLLYAAYSLLERSGCSFFYPGEKEQIIPSQASIRFKPGNETFIPVLEHRGLALYGLEASSVELGRNMIDWMAKNKFNYILVSENRPSDSDGPANGSIWKEVTATLLPELKKRGFIIEMSEHCTSVFFPTSLFKDHPDWFALNDGKRRLGKPPYTGQMCYSNKDAVEYYGNALADYASKHPEFHVIGVWPLDGGRYCECIHCKDPETYFKASMKVAEKIKAVRPDVIVEYLAYQGQYQAPGMKKIPANMSVLWCPDPGQKADTLKQWVEKAKDAGGVEQFEYFMGDNYRARCNVWLRPAFAASIPEQARISGFRGVISLFLPMQNWWRAAFNNWFFAKACWNKNLDIDSTVKAYCRDYYPEHAEEVNEVFQLIFHQFQQEPFIVPDPEQPASMDSMLVAAEVILKKLDKAIGQTQDDITKQRLIRLKSFVEFSKLHQFAFSTGKKADFDKVVSYSIQHPDQDMVIMYPGYIKWRDLEYFK
jgi:hypothetical protein